MKRRIHLLTPLVIAVLVLAAVTFCSANKGSVEEEPVGEGGSAGTAEDYPPEPDAASEMEEGRTSKKRYSNTESEESSSFENDPSSTSTEFAPESENFPRDEETPGFPSETTNENGETIPGETEDNGETTVPGEGTEGTETSTQPSETESSETSTKPSKSSSTETSTEKTGETAAAPKSGGAGVAGEYDEFPNEVPPQAAPSGSSGKYDFQATYSRMKGGDLSAEGIIGIVLGKTNMV